MSETEPVLMTYLTKAAWVRLAEDPDYQPQYPDDYYHEMRHPCPPPTLPA